MHEIVQSINTLAKLSPVVIWPELDIIFSLKV